MLLKKIYDRSSGKPVPTHVRVLRASKVQKFSPDFLNGLLYTGLATISAGKITIKTQEEEPDLVYRIVAQPGFYCCHCNVLLDGSPNDGTEAAKRRLEHVQKEHKDTPSPDPNNPAGYRYDAAITAVKDEEGLNHDQAEKIVQEERREVISRYGEKHQRSIENAIARKKDKTQSAGAVAPAAAKSPAKEPTVDKRRKV